MENSNVPVIQIKANLRMVPTIFSAHMFCASHKAWFNHHIHARASINVTDYATKYPAKMKAKFSYCD